MKTGRAESQPLSGVVLHEKVSSIGRIFERSLPARLHLSSHTHDYSLLTIVTQGGFREAVHGAEQLCLPHDVRLLPAGDTHTNTVTATSQCVQVAIAPKVATTAMDASGNFTTHGRIDGELVTILGARLLHESRQPDCCEATLEALILDLLNYAGRRAIVGNGKPPQWLNRVQRFIHDSYSGKISLSALADCAGVHPVHVSREFHRCFGCTIGDMVRRLRLRRACELMANKNLSLCTIAVECGFVDQSHFVATFRRYLRTTPSQYRTWINGPRHRDCASEI